MRSYRIEPCRIVYIVISKKTDEIEKDRPKAKGRREEIRGSEPEPINRKRIRAERDRVEVERGYFTVERDPLVE